ncbi:phage holin [Rothia sp. CCM 9416]|uniref:phage holin n=1 Tax=Rothia sp. CCM 9416 TaxID=3402655 RepID=UPI003ADE031F
MKWLSDNPQARKWVYGVALAVVPLLTAYGLVSEELAPLWVSLVSAVLVPGLALANTPGAGNSPEDEGK